MALLRRSLLGTLAAAPALAQTGEVNRLILAFPPGAALDGIARLLADAAPRAGLGATVVESRPGANGNIAAAFVARARPDGRTLLGTIDTGFTVNPHIYPNLGFDPRDLDPVAIIGTYPVTLLVHPSTGIADFAGFVAAARARPGLYVTAGPGSPGHLAMEALRHRLGLPATALEQVPMRGNAQAVAEILSGRVPFAFIAIGGGPQFIRDGSLRAIATSGRGRDPALPDVPTLQELGLADFEIRYAFMLFAPRGTPEPAREAWSRLAAETFAQPAIRARIEVFGIEADAGDGDAARAWIVRAHAAWGEVARAANLRVD